MHPNDIRRGTNLWLILTDNTFEQFDENHDFDQIDGNYTLEKGGSVEPLECNFFSTLHGSVWLGKARRAVVPFIWK